MLTVEQKIALLSLAGYGPYKGKSTMLPRICLGDPPRDIATLWRNGADQWKTDRIGRTETEPTTASWTDMQLDTCPDELIYQAIGATP